MEKAERHQDSSVELAGARRNLQTKVITLLNRRDQLKFKLEAVVTGSDVGALLEDEATQVKKFDEKEKRLIELEKETDEMKERLAKQSRAKAELGQGIQVLSQKLGISADDVRIMPESL